MNDLHDLMNRASDGDPSRAADPMTLLGQGRRRVRRRRGVTAVSGLAVASLAVAGAVAWLPDATPSGPDSTPPPVATAVDDGTYEAVEVSREEVGERCTTLFHNAFGSDDTFVVPPFVNDGPWFEGQTAQVSEANPDEGRWRWTISCEVPQAALVEQAGTLPATLPDATDHDGVRAACGQYLGWDFTGWEVITAASTDIATTSALRSTNGYVATCSLNAAPGHQGDGSYVAIERETPPRTEGLENEYAVWFSTDQYAGDNQAGDYNVFGVDQISGPGQAAQIVITEPDGTEHVSEVADNGWFAVAEDLRLEMNPHGVSPLRIKVLAADGDVLADYPDGEQSSECEKYPELCEGSAD
jgi:hypothetical protein